MFQIEVVKKVNYLVVYFKSDIMLCLCLFNKIFIFKMTKIRRLIFLSAVQKSEKLITSTFYIFFYSHSKNSAAIFESCKSPSTLLHSFLFPIFFFSLREVEDVNDNAPLTSDPIYHPVVMENSPKDVSVIRIQAQDPDLTSTPSRLSYRITAGNPQNFFAINPRTGESFSSNTL